MKKMFKYSALFVSVLALSACGLGSGGNGSDSASEDGKGTASNSKYEVSVKDGMYVQPQDESADSKFLALRVEVKNKGNKKFSYTNKDFALYNEDDEKIEPVQIYESRSKVKFIDYNDNLAKGKSSSGYVVYEVDKDQKYELHFSPSFFEDYKEDAKKEEITLKVNPSKYQDDIDDAKAVVENYIKAVYLDGENTGGAANVSNTGNGGEIIALADDKDDKKSDSSSDKDKKSAEASFTNDVKEDRNEFVKKFVSELGDEFDYYQASDDELQTFVNAYIKANAKRAKVSYKVRTYLPDYAVVYVRPETIDLANVNMTELTRKFVQENAEKFNNDYTELRKAADKFVLENVPSQFESTPLDTQDSMSKEGYEVRMSKKNGKWTIDTGENSYFDSIARAFRGSLGY